MERWMLNVMIRLGKRSFFTKSVELLAMPHAIIFDIGQSLTAEVVLSVSGEQFNLTYVEKSGDDGDYYYVKGSVTAVINKSGRHRKASPKLFKNPNNGWKQLPSNLYYARLLY